MSSSPRWATPTCKHLVLERRFWKCNGPGTSMMDISPNTPHAIRPCISTGNHLVALNSHDVQASQLKFTPILGMAQNETGRGFSLVHIPSCHLGTIVLRRNIVEAPIDFGNPEDVPTKTDVNQPGGSSGKGKGTLSRTGHQFSNPGSPNGRALWEPHFSAGKGHREGSVHKRLCGKATSLEGEYTLAHIAEPDVAGSWFGPPFFKIHPLMGSRAMWTGYLGRRG